MELAFADAVDVAVVSKEVEQGLGCGVLEELGDGGGELEAAFADGAVGEGGGVEVGAELDAFCHGTEPGGELVAGPGDDADDEGGGVAVGALGGEGEPVADLREGEAVGRGGVEGLAERGADKAGGLGVEDDGDGLGAGQLERGSG